MKRIFTVALALLCTSVAWGQSTKPVAKQSVKQQLAAIEQEAKPLLAQREANKKTLETLNKTDEDITFGYEALKKGAANYKTSLEAYNIDLGAYTPAAATLNSALDAHNANRCTKTQSNNCAEYEAEANRLNARRDYLQSVKNGLDSRKSTLDSTVASLRELNSVMQAKLEKHTADIKAYNAQNEDNEAKIKALAERYTALLTSLGDCVKKAGGDSATDEKLHDACGERWDGNIAHPAPVNKGTGGITPNN